MSENTKKHLKFHLQLLFYVPFLINVVSLGPSSASSPSVEYDIPVFEKSGKGGTYPRRYGIPFGLQDYSDGG